MSGGIFGAIGPVAPLLEALQQHRSGPSVAGSSPAPTVAPAPSTVPVDGPEPSIAHEPALEESA
jgi:hypothetical protein